MPRRFSKCFIPSALVSFLLVSMLTPYAYSQEMWVDGDGNTTPEYVKNLKLWAEGLKRDAQNCRRYLSENPPGSTCTISISHCGRTREVGLGEAELVAQKALRNAKEWEEALPELARLEMQIRLDLMAIERLGFETQISEIQSWTSFGDEERKSYRRANIAALFDSLLTSVSAGSAAAWDPESSGKAIKYIQNPKVKSALSRLRVDSESLVDNLRRIASGSTDQKTKALLVDSLVDQLSKVKDGISIGFSNSDTEVYIGLLKVALGFALKNPAATFLLTEIEWAVAGVYNFFAQRESLKYIKSITGRIEADLKLLKARQEDLTKSVLAHKEFTDRLPNCDNHGAL